MAKFFEKSGSLELAQQNEKISGLFSDVASEVKFLDRELRCKTFESSVICSASVNGRSVVPGGQWVSWMPYIAGIGAIYYTGRAVLGAKHLSQKKTTLQKISAAQLRGANEKILEKSLKRIGIDLFKAAAFLGASVAIYYFDSKYYRI